MKLTAEIISKLDKGIREELKRGEIAAFSGVDRATQGLKEELRGQITGAGMGKRLANTWRSKTYPDDRRSLKPAGYIWSKAPEIVLAHAEGATIKSRTGGYLAIPLPAAGRRGGTAPLTPREWERAHGQQLRFVGRRRGGALLVAENARLTKSGLARTRKAKGAARISVPIFVLVPQVTLKRKLNIDTPIKKWGDRIPSLVAAAWK